MVKCILDVPSEPCRDLFLLQLYARYSALFLAISVSFNHGRFYLTHFIDEQTMSFGVMFLKSSLGLPDSGPSRREWQVLRAQNLEPDNMDFIPASPQANTYILGKLLNPTVPRFSCL